MSIDDSNEPRLRRAREAAQPSVGPPAHPAPPPAPAGTGTPPRPPAWRLNAYGSPQPSQQGAGPRRQAPPPRSPPFQPNLLLRVAQLAAVAQGGMGVFTGINVIRGAVPLRDIAAGVNLSGASHSTATGYGIATIIAGGLVIVAAILMGRPSTIARVAVALWTVVAFGVSLAAFYRGGSVLGFVTVIVFAATGGAIVPAAAVLSIDAVIFYALALHPATYRAFAERGGAPVRDVSVGWSYHSSPPAPVSRQPAPMLSEARTPTAPAREGPAVSAAAPQMQLPLAIPAPPTTQHPQDAAAVEPPPVRLAAPRKRPKLPRLPVTKRPPASAAPASGGPTGAPAPASQARDYSPPQRAEAVKDTPAAADGASPDEGEPPG